MIATGTFRLRYSESSLCRALRLRYPETALCRHFMTPLSRNFSLPVLYDAAILKLLFAGTFFSCLPIYPDKMSSLLSLKKSDGAQK